MNLEEELKVKQFRNGRQKLHLNLIYTYNWMITQMHTVFKSQGITMQQFNVLRILRGQNGKPSTIQLLKDRMMDKQSDASRLVDRLASKGLVKRESSKEDRRKMDVYISDKGLKLLEQMDPQALEFENFFDLVSDEDVDRVNEVLDRIRDKK
jgi:DNA-binding MarR family transcriptional regulator